MAKFQDKHLKLRDNQRVYFGDNDECSIWRDGSQLRVSCTLSGVDPTQSYHLTTRWYVDDEIATLSGTIPYSFTELSDTPDSYTGKAGLFTVVKGDETGLEFVTASGIDHGDLGGLTDDDHPQYILVDGTRDFTGIVEYSSHPTFVDDTDIVDKKYVDDLVADKTETGRTLLALDDFSKSVVFGTAFADTNYSLNVMMRNIVDSNPSIYPMITTATTVSGFTVLFSGDVDSNNYYLDWTATHD